MLILFNKPYRVLSQFSDSDGRKTLADFVDTPKVYPAGRLDYDSEGLLLLTDDGRLQARISQPGAKIPKSYWVQVEGQPQDAQLRALLRGVQLKDGLLKARAATAIAPLPGLWERKPPIRYRASVADSWLELTLTQGRNRQVRRMTAAVGLPTLRLIRHSIGPWSINGMQPGEMRCLAGKEAWRQLNA